MNNSQSKAAAVAKEIYLKCIEFGAKDLQMVISAENNSQRTMFNFCWSTALRSWTSGFNRNCSTEYLSFQLWGSAHFNERTTDWKTDPSCFSRIVEGIWSSGLRASLRKINIKWSQILSQLKSQKLFNVKEMLNVSVV